MHELNGADLDRWITGNYGEDQMLFEPSTCARCGETIEDGAWRVCDECGHPNAHECPDGTLYCPECEMEAEYREYLAEEDVWMPPAWCPTCGADLTEAESVRIINKVGTSRPAHAEPDGYYQDRATLLDEQIERIECCKCQGLLPGGS